MHEFLEEAVNLLLDILLWTFILAFEAGGLMIALYIVLSMAASVFLKIIGVCFVLAVSLAIITRILH